MICWLVSAYRVFEITYCLRLLSKGPENASSSQKRVLRLLGSKEGGSKFLRSVGNNVPVDTAYYPESYHLRKYTGGPPVTYHIPFSAPLSAVQTDAYRRLFVAPPEKFRFVLLNQAIIVLPNYNVNSAPTDYTGSVSTIRFKCVYYHWFIVCRFCVLRCLIILCLYLLLSNYSIYVFLIFFLCFVFLFCMFVFCLFCVFVLFCVSFLLLYVAVSFLFL